MAGTDAELQQALLEAVKRRDYSSVQALLRDSRAAPAVADAATGKSCLHVAAAAGDSSMLTVLLSADRVNVDAADVDGNAALHVAVARDAGGDADVAERVQCVQALLVGGASVRNPLCLFLCVSCL